MEDYVKQCIIEFANAQRAAAHNAELLLQDWTKGDECASRMRVLANAEEDLLALGGRPNLPAVLTRYLEANDDKGCAQCWLTSSMNTHPECIKKSNEYFTARTNLIQFGSTL